MEYQIRNWYHFVWLCGDNICEQHVHNLDVCNWVKDDHPVKANGMGACVQRYAHAIRRRAWARSSTTTSSSSPTRTAARCTASAASMPHTWENVSEAVHGAKGSQAASPAARGGRNPYQQEHVDLVDAIRKGEKHNDGWYGATSSFTAVLGPHGDLFRPGWSSGTRPWPRGPSEMPERFALDADPPALPDKDGRYPIPVPGLYKAY